MIQSSINQLIGTMSKVAKKLDGAGEATKALKNAAGNEHAALVIQQKQEQANNNFIKNYITPGDIRRELEAKEAAKAKIAAEKGIYEEDYFDEENK